MAEIQKLPKYSRIDQQRPPLLGAPVDADLLARMQLPRCPPPKPAARGRSRKPAQAAAGQLNLTPAGKPDQKPAETHAQPQVGSGQPPAGPEQKPGLSQTPPAPRPTAQSPYEKRPPFNTSLPRRDAPPSGSPSMGKPGASSKPPAPGSLAVRNVPGANRTDNSGPANASRLPGMGMPTRGPQPAPRRSPFAPTPSESDAPRSPSQPPGQGRPANEAQSGPGSPSARPSDPRRPLSGTLSSEQRVPESRPGQPRPFRLPPLDFNFGEPPASALPDDPQPDEHFGENPETGQSIPSDQRPANRPGYHREEQRPRRASYSENRHARPADLETEPAPEPGSDIQPDVQLAAQPVPSIDRFTEPPSLRDLLLSSSSLPAQTAILGVANHDQLPVLLDLNDPAPGSLLVVGDERQQALDLLRVAVTSVALRNTARGVQFIVFSHRPETWNQWVEEQGLWRYSLAIVGAESSQAREWIDRLAEWAEQRDSGQSGGPPVVVLFDTLSFMTRLQPDARQHLENLIRSGPDVRIWSIAAISTALAGSLGRQLEQFDTRIWGYTEDPAVYTRLAGVPAGDARRFGAPGQFAVRVGPAGEQDWLKFRLPSLDGLLP